MGKSILVADDEKEIGSLIKRVLEREGYTVFTATDGIEAISKARELNPDLILLDINLPGVDGFEVCRKIKGNDVCKNIPVLMFSGFIEETYMEASYISGADEFMTKPFSMEALLEGVQRLTGTMGGLKRRMVK